MRQFYMDANVFISRLRPGDPYHSEARSILEGVKGGEMTAETSVFTLLEVASVSGRLFRPKRGGEAGEKERKVFVAKALRRLAGLKVRFINIAGDGPLALRGIEATLPSVFNEAILLSLQSTLRTLDLIHLAAARHAKRMNGALEAFVTGDDGFLSDRARLADVIGMPVVSPAEYVASPARR